MPSVALFIDGANMRSEFYTIILQNAQTFGEVALKFLYLDGTSNHTGWKKIADQDKTLTVKPLKQQKNNADIVMSMDIFELAYSDYDYVSDVLYFIIASNDKGLSIAVPRVRQKKYVLLFASQTAAEDLIRSCDIYFNLDKLRETLHEPLIPENLIRPTPVDLIDKLKRAFAAARSNKKEEWIQLSSIGNQLKKQDTKFDCTKYGAPTLSRLLTKEGFEVEKNESGQYVVKDRWL